MTRIFLEQILEYYDGIQLFVGKDIFGSRYLCSLYYDEHLAEEFYLSIRVSDRRLAELFNHELDLRKALLEPELPGEYFKIDWKGSEFYEATAFEDGFRPSEIMLPEEGYCCESTSMTNELADALIASSRPVFAIGANDNKGSHSMSTKVASQLLESISSMFNASKKTYREELEVIDTQRASFNFILATKEQADMFHNIPPKTEEAFERIGHLFSLLETQDLSNEKLTDKEYNALIKLANTYADNNLSLKYSYIISPDDAYTTKTYIKNSDIVKFRDKSISVEHTEVSETLTAKGYFQKCDNKKGDWTFVTTEGEVRTGKSEKDALSGIVIAEQEYTITFQTTTEVSGVNREKVTAQLLSFEPTADNQLNR